MCNCLYCIGTSGLLEQQIAAYKAEISKLQKDFIDREAIARQPNVQLKEVETVCREGWQQHFDLVSFQLRERLRYQGEVMKRTEEMHRNQLSELQHQLQLLIEQYQAVDQDRSRQLDELQDENAKLQVATWLFSLLLLIW